MDKSSIDVGQEELASVRGVLALIDEVFLEGKRREGRDFAVGISLVFDKVVVIRHSGVSKHLDNGGILHGPFEGRNGGCISDIGKEG